jgi:hypothetical protein
MIAIIIRFFVLLRTKIIKTILNVIHKNQKQLLLDMIQDITSINGGAIPNSCSLCQDRLAHRRAPDKYASQAT